MKSVLAMILFAAAASAQYYGSSAPMAYGSSATTPIPIVRLTQNIGENGANSDFETGNGIKFQEDTQVVSGATRVIDDGYGNKMTTDKEIKKSGSYSYTAPDGQVITTSYVADKDGVKVSGSHLPVAPEMPAELKAAYAEVAARPVERVVDSYAPVRSSYAAPAPAVRELTYTAPAPVVRELTYTAPAPAIRMNSYSAPAPAQEIRINYAPLRSTY